MLQALAGVEVTAVRDLDSGLDTAQAEGRSRLPWHKGDLMMTFTLDNVHTLTLRASGTEPKLKYYLEVIMNSMVQQANLCLKLDVGLHCARRLSVLRQECASTLQDVSTCSCS